jgi:molybdenum cofactor cytidylyltransferase
MNDPVIGAVVLAAGKSVRMGKPKMSLPWGKTTVIGQVVTALVGAGLGEVLVVTGGGRDDVERALSYLPQNWPVRAIFNPDFAAGEMLSSIQVGVGALGNSCEAALITLGDQPQIEVDVVRIILETYYHSGASLVIPSYAMRRGHPMLISRPLWSGLLALRPPQTLRELIQANKSEIVYVNVDTPSILLDLDTPEDYQQFKPGDADH